MAAFHIVPVRWHVTIIIFICLIFLVIGIATTNWVHYKWITYSEHIGLWRICKFSDKGIKLECKDTEYLVIKIVLIISAAFGALALVCIFCIINKCLRHVNSFFFPFCIFVAVTLSWAGIALFTKEVEIDRTTGKKKYEWSFIIACTGAVTITILLPFTIWYVVCESKRNNPNSMYHQKKTKRGVTDGNTGIVNVGIDETYIPEKKPGAQDEPADIIAGEGNVVLKTFTQIEPGETPKVMLKSFSPEAPDPPKVDEVASEAYESEPDTAESEPARKPGYSSLTLYSTDAALRELESYLEKEQASYI